MSSPISLNLDSLLYGYVKEKNPCMLTQMFSRERCRELEKLDHLYDQTILPSMLREYRRTHSKTVNANEHVEDNAVAPGVIPASCATRSVALKHGQDMMHRRFCCLTDLETSVDLTTFNYFHLNGDTKTLETIFDEETREKFAKMVTKVDVPTVVRLLAHRKRKLAVVERRTLREISKCQLCKHHLKGPTAILMNHIGLHEDISSYCIVEGCDKYVKQCGGFSSHLKSKHALMAADLSSEQYHHLQAIHSAFYKKATVYMDKYFPPESFIGFSDKKIIRSSDLESETCAKCGKIVKERHARRRHVSEHLKLSYGCVIAGCQAVVVIPTFYCSHLRDCHSKKVDQLTAAELHQHKQNKVAFNSVMKKEIPKYFPLKSGASE